MDEIGVTFFSFFLSWASPSKLEFIAQNIWKSSNFQNPEMFNLQNL